MFPLTTENNPEFGTLGNSYFMLLGGGGVVLLRGEGISRAQWLEPWGGLPIFEPLLTGPFCQRAAAGLASFCNVYKSSASRQCGKIF